MEIDIKRLKQVVTIARTGNISRAAEELHITQPALSRSISTLEERFGIRIFERGRSGAKLTPTGKLVVAEAEELLRRTRTLEHNFRLYGLGEAGKIAFGMGPLIAGLVLPDLSIHFVNSHPGLLMRASVKAAGVLLQELLDDNIEILFCASEAIGTTQDICIEPVGQVYISMLVREGHPLAGKDAVTVSDLSRYPVLSGAEHSTVGLGGASVAFICDNYQIMRETVLHTDGIWMSSPQFVADDLQSGRLKQLLLMDGIRPPRIDVCMARREGSMLSPAAAAISAYVRLFFGNLETPAMPSA